MGIDFKKSEPDLVNWGTIRLGGKEYCLMYDRNNFHTVQTNNEYVDVGSKELMPFSGHRFRWRVELNEYNYLKTSELSGNEIRKGGLGKLFVNGAQVYEFFFREIRDALLDARTYITQLSEHPIWIGDLGKRDKVVNRLIYFYEEPSVIVDYLPEQGAIIIRREDNKPFKQHAWQEGMGVNEDVVEIKEDILSSHIWWWRENVLTPIETKGELSSIGDDENNKKV